MNQPVNGTEDRLREALRREAAHADGLGTGFAQVRARAVRVRRRRRVVTATLAAAAVAVVTVPTTLVLRNDEKAGTEPTHQPTVPPTVSPSPNTPTTAPPTVTKSPSPGNGPLLLSSIEEGRAPGTPYLQGRIFVAADGSRTALPGKRPVSEFTVYHGGWLVVDADDAHLYQYDNEGNETDLGRNGIVRVSGDQMQTLYEAGGVTKIGISTGMGEGEQTVPLPKDAGVVGFVGQDLVYGTGNGTWVHPADGGADRKLPELIGPQATSPGTGLVGGMVATGDAGDGVLGAVADANTDTMLWKNRWRPLSFSPDGKYVAAVPAGDNGDAEWIAILDARTGRTVQHMQLFDRKLYLMGLPPAIAWDEDDSLLFDVADKTGHEAILRLGVDGSLTRATPPAPTVDAQPAYLFPAQP
jgi:hypothetical protein